VRVHIDCPTSGGNPIAGTTGINLQQGDGNTFTGGDVEGCATALHLGANAQNNTMVGLRNENSTSQVVADSGSTYNNWITGGTMFTGQLTDNGTRNSFLDTFHRAFNGLNGDWYGSQKDATVTNHYRLGTGAGNERGLMNEIQTDFGYRWIEGYTDATAGEQFYQVQDLLNNVNRLSIGQYNNGQSSANNQTVINAAGTGAVVLNGSNSAGTGGVIIGSGGASSSTVATVDNAGDALFNGSLQVGGTAIKFPGIAASSGHNCVQIDNSGNVTNTGAACGAGGGGSVGSANSGQIAYYMGNGTSIGGVSQVGLSAGGTGASTAAGALTSLGAQAAVPGMASDGANGVQVSANGTFGGTVAALNVLPERIGNVFYVDGFPAGGCTVAGTAYTTNLDCAVATAKAWIATALRPGVLELGIGSYNTNVGITLPSNNSGVSLSIEGKGTSTPGFGTNINGTIINQTAPIVGHAVIYQPPAQLVNGTYQFPSIFIRGVAIMAGTNAPSCLEIFGGRQVSVEHVSCEAQTAGLTTDHLVAISDPNPAHSGFQGPGYVYESSVNDLFIQDYGTSGVAAVSPNIVSGGLASGISTPATPGSLTISNAGSFSGGVPSVLFYGHSNTSMQPCTVMPVATATLSGGTSGTLTQINVTTAGSGCTGTLDVQVQPTSQINYGLSTMYISDSTFKDIRVVGTYLIAGTVTNGGSNTFDHMHNYGMAVEYQVFGGQSWSNTECDSPWKYCFDFEGPNVVVTGSNFFPAGSGEPGSSFAYFAPTATNVKIHGLACVSQQSMGDYNTFLTNAGPSSTALSAGGSLPLGTDAFGIGGCASTANSFSVASSPMNGLTIGVNANGTTVANSYSLVLQDDQAGSTESISLNTNTDASNYDQLVMNWQNSSHAPNGESLNLVNNTAATSVSGTITNYNTPMIEATGNWYNSSTSKSAQAFYTIQGLIGTGAAPPFTLKFGYGGTGQPSISFPFTMSGTTLYSEVMGGTLTATRNVYFPDATINMVVGQVASSNFTAQTGNTAQTTLTPGGGALPGMYRITCYAVVVTPATTSSTLPGCDVYFTDADSGVAPSFEPVTGTNIGNVAGTVQMQGDYRFNAKAGTAIQYAAVNYASVGTQAMVYGIHARLEYLGQ